MSAAGVRARIADVLVVVVVGLLIVGSAHGQDRHGSHSGWGLVADVALALPLLARRRWPFESFLVMAAIALIQWTTDTIVGGDFAILFALYAVGAHEQRRRRVAVAAAICEFGVLIAVLRWTPPERQVGAIVFLSGTVTAAGVLGVYLRTRRAFVAAVLERAVTAERDRDHQAMLATASERARISREMHDIVAHSLSVMIALSDGAAAAVPRSPEAAQNAMLEASALGRQALGEVRRLLGSLQPQDGVELAPAPGIAQLDDLAARVRAAGLQVELVIVGEAVPLPPGTQLTVYRMVQEALTNVLKHARAATLVTVTLRYGEQALDIEIENDDAAPDGAQRPPGPEPGTLPPPGHGLAGMRERAAVFAGSVSAGRRDDGGWRVTSHLRLDGPPS
jgi:signal transduction histidine kinase